MVSCGISTSFPVLFPTERKVAHALLTRPPLEQSPKQLSPLDLHVLGTPPAFVLSQDQTLAFNPLCLIGFTDQVQLIRNYCLLFAFLLFCIVFKVQCPLLRCPARASLFILSPNPGNVNTFLQTFSLFFRVFSVSELSTRSSPAKFRPQPFSSVQSLPRVRQQCASRHTFSGPHHDFRLAKAPSVMLQ